MYTKPQTYTTSQTTHTHTHTHTHTRTHSFGTFMELLLTCFGLAFLGQCQQLAVTQRDWCVLEPTNVPRCWSSPVGSLNRLRLNKSFYEDGSSDYPCGLNASGHVVCRICSINNSARCFAPAPTQAS